MAKILIVEDDELIARLIKEQLNHWGFDAFTIQDFSKVDQEFKQINPDLVLLDITLPFYNGYYWCNEIRKYSDTSIMFISSASDNMNIVMAMNMGGDDFIAKPFDMDVLVAKIQAVLRRAGKQRKAEELNISGLVLNKDKAKIQYKEKEIDLTKNEFRILLELMEKKGRIVSRDELMQALWKTDEFIDDNTLTVNVTRLRKKLEEVGLKDFVLTKKGIGYIIP